MDFRSFAQKKQFVCRENARRVSFLLHCQLGLRQFLIGIFFRKFSLESKRTNHFFQSSLGGQEKIGWTQENCSEQKLVLRIGKSVASCRFSYRMTKKKCYGGRSWCIIKGSLVSKLPRYGRLSWPAFSILMHSHHHVNHIIMSTTSTCHSYSWEM